MAPRAVILLASMVSATLAQFINPPTDLTTAAGYAGVNVRYREVPEGTCELNASVKSYAGYSDVADNKHIFWWFFEARDVDPKEAPLTTWINGGPGSSSMMNVSLRKGLLQENGPCTIDAEGNPLDNPFSWSKYSNMLYIDQPVTTGWSYTIPTNGYFDPNTGKFTPLNGTDCPADQIGNCGTGSLAEAGLIPNSTASAAPDFYLTVQGFMGAFPAYSRNAFHFASESFGGHYGPIFNEYIEQQNAYLPAGAHEIHLETVLIGNGWYDPLVQYPAYYDFMVTPGNTYDYAPYNESIQTLVYNALYGAGNCTDRIQNCTSTGDDTACYNARVFCTENVQAAFDHVTPRDEFDIRELDPDPFPLEYYYNWLNTAPVQQAIGAFVNYSDSSYDVEIAFSYTGDSGREDGTIEGMQKLIAQNVTVMMYTGDADYNCNWLGGQAVAQQISPDGMSTAGYADIQTSDGVCHGAVKQMGKFSFARIYEAGHMVPFYQPLASQEIFYRAISGKDIATGSEVVGAGYATSGPAESTYREGNITLQWSVLPANATYNTTTNEPNPQ